VCTTDLNETILILVDALDEALTFGSPNITTLLAGASDLPDCVRFVLTSRIEPKVIDQFLQRRQLNLSDPAHADDNSGDVRAYLKRRLKDDQLQQRLAAIGSPDKIGTLSSSNPPATSSILAFYWTRSQLATLCGNNRRPAQGPVRLVP